MDLTVRKTSEENYNGDNNEVKPVLTVNLTANRSTQFDGGNDEKKRSLAANIENLKQRCRDLEIECNEYEHTLKGKVHKNYLYSFALLELERLYFRIYYLKAVIFYLYCEHIVKHCNGINYIYITCPYN